MKYNGNLTNAALLEIDELQTRALELSSGSQKDRAESAVLLSRVATITRCGTSTEERAAIKKAARIEKAEKRYSELFAQYVCGKLPKDEFEHRCAVELRADDQQFGLWGRPISETYVGGDLQGGLASGISGAYTVPVDFFHSAINSTKAFAPLASEDNVTLVKEKTYALPARVFAGWDFGSFKAQRQDSSVAPSPGVPGTTGGTGDAVQNFGNNSSVSEAPPAYLKLLGSNIYTVVLRVDMSLEQDAMNGFDGGILQSLSEGFGEGFGRSMAGDLVIGTGTNQPSGILTGAASSGVSAGVVSYNLLKDTLHSVNPAYRASKKAAWVLTDSVLKQIRALEDDQHRPLLSVSEGDTVLMGKKVLIAPELPVYNGSASPVVAGALLFGDLSKYVVRVSAMTVKRLNERYADFHEAALVGRLRADAVVFNPDSSGTNPPIVKTSLLS